MTNLLTCPECEAELSADAPGGVCPKCLLEAGLADAGGFPALHIRCPHCSNPVEIVDNEPLKDLTCPSCDSRFSLVDDQTFDYRRDTPATIGRFELLEQVGTGSFGTVWKARDTELDRHVAVKIPRKGQLSSAESELFLREARAAGQLRHANIVSVHEVGRDDDQIFIISDLVDGVTLADWLSAKQPTPPESAELCAKIAEALHHAHQAGVIHRDLKPSNIMLDDNGEPHIMDFGLAKRETGEITMTIEGKILGTPAYMSPEQAQGESHEADCRADIYSLGVILYELLTGQLPFRGNTRMLLQQVINEDAPRPRQFNSSIPRDLETICLKCLQKEPRRRYADADELTKDLRCFLEDRPIVARPVGRTERGWRWCRRNPLVAGLSVAVILCLVGGTVASLCFAIDAQKRAAQAAKSKKNALYMAKIARAARDEEATQRREADRLRAEAERQARVSNARRLAARSRETLREHPERSLLLAVEAIRATQGNNEPVVTVAEQTLRDALATVGGRAAHAYNVKTTVFAITSRWLVTQDDQATHLFDLKEKDPIAAVVDLMGHRSLAISQDHQLLVTVSDSKALTLWDLDSADPFASPRVLDEDSEQIEFAALAADNRWLVTKTNDEAMRLWNLVAESNDEPLVLPGHTPHAVSPDGQWLVTESENNSAHLWDLADGASKADPIELGMLGEPGNFLSVVFSPNSRWLVIGGSQDKKTRFWDLRSDNPAKPWFVSEPVNRRFGKEAFSPDSRWLFVPASYKSRAWDMAEKDPSLSPIDLDTQTTKSDHIHSFSADGGVLVVGNRIWALSSDEKIENRQRGERTEQKKSVVMFHAHPTSILDQRPNCVAHSPNSQWRAIGYRDKTIQVLRLKDQFAEPITLRGHKDAVVSLSFSPDDRWLISTGAEGTVRLWDLTSKVPGTTPMVLRGLIALAVSPNGRWLATGQRRSATEWHSARLFDLSELDPTAQSVDLSGQEKRGIRRAVFSPDSRWLATVDFKMTLCLWDMNSDDRSNPTILIDGPKLNLDLRMTKMMFSPDSRWLVYGGSGDKNQTCHLWDLTVDDPAKQPILLDKHPQYPPHVAFSPSSRWLVSVTEQNSVASDRAVARLWDLASQDPASRVMDLPGHAGGVRFSDFSKDDRWLITSAGKTNAVRLWNLNARDASEMPFELYGHKGQITAVELSSDKRWLVTASADKTVRLWDLSKPNPSDSPSILGPFGDIPSRPWFSPNGHWLCVWNETEDVTRLWNLVSGVHPRSPPLKVEGYVSRRISPDNRWLVSANKLWSLEGGKISSTQVEIKGTPEFSPDGHCLVVYSMHAKTNLHDARIWNLSGPSPAATPIDLTGALSRHTRSVVPRTLLYPMERTFSPDGRWLFTSGPRGFAQILNLRLPDLMNQARRTAGRTLTEEERKTYLLPDVKPDNPKSREQGAGETKASMLMRRSAGKN